MTIKNQINGQFDVLKKRIRTVSPIAVLGVIGLFVGLRMGWAWMQNPVLTDLRKLVIAVIIVAVSFAALESVLKRSKSDDDSEEK
jgi:hypothetical protein